MLEFLIKVLVCIVAGIGAGVGTGFAGMSAAAIVAPLLVTFLGVEPYIAIGIGLVSDVLASAISAYNYKKNKNIDIRDGLIMMVCVLLFTVVGSFVANYIPAKTMGNTSIICMGVIGLRFILFPLTTTKSQMDEIPKSKKIIGAILGGIVVGFICGFVGAGGGMMMLFVLTTFLGYELHIAVGTSVFIMAFTAFTGAVSHFVIGGMPDLTITGLCILFTFIFSAIASKIANKANTKTLNRIVGIVLVLLSVTVIVVNYLRK